MLKLAKASPNGNKIWELGRVRPILIGSDDELNNVSINRIIESIRTGNFLDKFDMKLLTEIMDNYPESIHQSKLLEKIPMVNFAGHYNAAGNFRYSGLMAIQLKNPKNPESLRDAAGMMESAYASYVTLSGNVIALLRVKPDNYKQYKELFEAFMYFFESAFGIDVDERCGSRDWLAPLAFDPNIKVNSNGHRLF